jgi:simple sugar transport system substrate-binding protein
MAATVNAAATAAGTRAATGTAGFKIGLVTDVGKVDDRSFNQSAWEGAQAAAKELGGTADFIETTNPTDYASNIQQFADRDYNVIVTVGFALGDATSKAAAKYPNIHFIGVDQFQGAEIKNVTGLIFPEAQSGYLAGILAARMSKSGTIAAVLGTDQVPPVVAFKEGYEAGARSVKADIKILSTYHPGGLDKAFDDPTWGATTAGQAIDQGADVVFGAGGKTGNGALQEVAKRTTKDKPLYCIGVDTDQWGTVPEAHPCLISSAMKLITPGVSGLIAQVKNGTIKGGNFLGDVDLAPFHDFDSVVPQSVKDEIAKAKADLKSGKLNATGAPAQATAAATAAAPAATSAATQAAAPATAAPTQAASSGDLVVGFVLVGPKEDKGWSEAHFRAAEYVEQKLPGVKKIVVEKLNPADQPNVTLDQVVQNMKSEGAKLIITTSDSFQVDTLAAAKKYTDITFVNISGDDVLKGAAPSNLGNIMGRVEYMKMMGGCAAALATEKKSVAYLGPLINDETRRLAVSAFLGARYCYTKYRGGAAADLKFEVKWIGFWFNIPGVTLDPNDVTNSFFNGGADVVISGIDTTEAIVIAKQRADKGEKVWAVPYDYRGACELGAKICLGVPYFNWGPAYLKLVTDFKEGKWKQSWDWNGPDWKDINNADTSHVGFIYGEGLTAEQKTNLQAFEKDLASGAVNLFTGPLKYQSGKVYLEEGKTANDQQIWYMPELLEGMIGQSVEQK